MSDGLAITGIAVGIGIVLSLLAVTALRRRDRTRAVLTETGVQEARILVNGRYRPNVVEVTQGTPVRLRFFRSEDEPCSERVIFGGMGISRRLPAFKETVIEFLPQEPGTFMFTCELGMYRGSLIVRAPAQKGADRGAPG